MRFNVNAGYPDYDNGYIFKTNFKENTRYTFVFDFLNTTSINQNIVIYYTDGTTERVLNSLSNTWKKAIFTSQLNRTIKYIATGYYSGTKYIDLDTFMVLEGAYTEQTIPDYVPHAEQNLPFALEEGQFLATGETLEDDGIHKKYVKIVLNGTEEWSFYIESSIHSFKMRLPILSQNGICTHYTKIGGNQLDIKNGIYLTYSIYVIISDLRFSTVEELKVYLAEQYANGTPVIIVYETTTEQIVPYTPLQQTQYNAIKKAHSYNDVTYIESTSDELPPILEVQYWKKNDAEVITPQENENKVEFVDELPDNENSYNLDEIENLINPIEVESEVIEDETNN